MVILRELLDEKSTISTMRVMSLVSLLTGCVLGIYGVYMNRDLVGLAALCGVFITAAFGGKMAQKVVEVKNQ